jgi:plasmid stabilization system protein ParE
MSATLHLFKTALDDLQDALDWYESQSIGLEQRFSKEINERLAFITTYPEASPVRVEHFRGAQLKKFPYTIYYDFEETQNTVHIAAVLHNKRDKNVLKERL